jgi:glutaredoxin-dependent peroxiredoxin
MKHLFAACLLLILTSASLVTPAQTQKPEVSKLSLKVGDAAPDFTLLSDQWKNVKLSDYRGKKNVFLAIYVLAFTGGWTKQLQAVQSGITAGKIDPSDTEVFGVSMDSPAANAAFAKQISIKFPLLSDMNKKMLKEYGILKGYDVQNETYQWAQRANIVIDKNGIIQHIEEGDSAVDPNTAMSVCTDLHKKQAAK